MAIMRRSRNSLPHRPPDVVPEQLRSCRSASTSGGCARGSVSLTLVSVWPDRAGHIKPPEEEVVSDAGKAFVIRFPSGDFEYDLTVTGRALPVLGDTMRRKGVLWLVTRITKGSSTSFTLSVSIRKAD